MATVGRYELEEILGEGGFGSVYRAWDPIARRHVALKMLQPHLAARADIRARFLGEVRALAPLGHEHIVQFLDVDETADEPFFTMELIEGPTISELIQPDTGLELAQVVTILRGLCSAIDYLHTAGIVHRDLKASNVMLDPNGRAVLMDFGIARVLDQEALTRTGTLMGTPESMAPEQIRGLPVGPPADIYSLGVLAYLMLAGRPPFTGDPVHVLYAQVYEAPPPLRDRRPDLADHVIAAVDEALAKEPTARPATALTFWAALAAPPERAAALLRTGGPTAPLAPLPAREAAPRPSSPLATPASMPPTVLSATPPPATPPPATPPPATPTPPTPAPAVQAAGPTTPQRPTAPPAAATPPLGVTLVQPATPPTGSPDDAADPSAARADGDADDAGAPLASAGAVATATDATVVAATSNAAWAEPLTDADESAAANQARTPPPVVPVELVAPPADDQTVGDAGLLSADEREPVDALAALAEVAATLARPLAPAPDQAAVAPVAPPDPAMTLAQPTDAAPDVAARPVTPPPADPERAPAPPVAAFDPGATLAQPLTPADGDATVAWLSADRPAVGATTIARPAVTDADQPTPAGKRSARGVLLGAGAGVALAAGIVGALLLRGGDPAPTGPDVAAAAPPAATAVATATATATASPTPAPPTRATVVGVEVFDNVFSKQRDDFVADEQVTVCFTATGGSDPAPLHILLTAESVSTPPSADDAAVLGRSDPAPAGDGCRETRIVRQPLPAGAYVVWVMQGSESLARATFRVVDPPPPPPTPTPTPAPTAAPTTAPAPPPASVAPQPTRPPAPPPTSAPAPVVQPTRAPVQPPPPPVVQPTRPPAPPPTIAPPVVQPTAPPPPPPTPAPLRTPPPLPGS